jgi:magnesium chelatase subunit D
LSVPFPLSAVVGQEDLKLALLLHAVDPRLGGVLIRGEKGSGKSTAGRGLAALLPPLSAVPGCPFACAPPECPHGKGTEARPAPFVELPVGATEDRVVGALDLEGALLEGRRRLQPGLLAAAHRGVLYVDEVNLLPDHLVDLLIDAAASGVNRVERDGLAVEHASRFVLVGSMNPEEGELRPQLLDRFGLAVEVRAPRDPAVRAEVVRRRLAYDAGPAAFAAAYAAEEQAWAEAIATAGGRLAEGVTVPDAVLALASGLCAELDAEGLRADLVLARGAAALAALDGREEATGDDVVRLAPLALAHRRRRGPLDAPGLDPGELEEAIQRLEQEAGQAGDGTPGSDEPASPGDGRPGSDGPASPGGAGPGSTAPGPGRAPGRPPATAVPGVRLAFQSDRPSGALGRRGRGPADRGGVVAARPADGPVSDMAMVATVQVAAARRALDQDGDGHGEGRGRGLVEPADLRQAVREARTSNLVVLCVDASGSMGAHARMEAAKGAVLSLLVDSYQRRDRVAVVTFAGEEARVALRPTGSVEVAQARLAELPTGGRTPLAAGLRSALEVARSALRVDPARRPILVVVTDGRATSGGPEPGAAALAAATDIARAGFEALVVDAEDADIRLGLARRLAEAMGAGYVALPDLAGDSLARAVATVTAGTVAGPDGSAKL